MEKTELRTKSEIELQHLLRDLQRSLRSLKFDLASGKIKNVRLVRNTKRDIAQVMTILNEKKHAHVKK